MKSSLAFLAAALLFPTTSGATTDVEWLDDLDAAESLARKTGKPILAVFR